MAITLITPANEWITGATVQFKFDLSGSAIRNWTDNGWMVLGDWTNLLMGTAKYTPGEGWSDWVVRLLWTEQQILDFANSNDPRLIGYSFDIFNATSIGQDFIDYPDDPYFINEEYADLVSIVPSSDDVTWTETLIGSGEYSYRFTDIYEFRTYTGNQIEVSTVSSRNYNVASEAIADAGEAYFAGNPPHQTGQDRACYWFDLDGSIIENLSDQDVGESPGFDCISVSFGGSGTALVIESSSGKDYLLSSQEVVVTVQLKKDLPPGGLYLFCPIYAQDWTSTLFPPFYPNTDYAAEDGTAYVSSYTSLLVKPVTVELISPADDATEVHSKDILTAKVTGVSETTVVSSVQLYLNTVKVYDGGPQGPKPYLAWYVGTYCQPGTEYDWYVTATIDGAVCQSEIWTFTTAERQDLHPSFYYSTTWDTSTPAYDIYFGTVSGDLDLIVEDWVEPEWEWDIYPLDYDTDYYWRINDGPEYHFKTMPMYPPQWQVKNLRLVAAANNKIWYEDI